ncbi:MAG: hypothetical protein RLZZ142_2417 [Verrucomicrobiota bacterium]
MKTIAVLGTFDSKGAELEAVADMIEGRGFGVLRIDVGSGVPQVRVDVRADEVLSVLEAEGMESREAPARRDRGAWVALIAEAAGRYLKELVGNHAVHGVISLGGGGGTAIGTAAMRPLPIGFPKVMVSTLASGNVAPFIGTVDIVMIPAVVDVAGLNRISRVIFENAAGAICGMVDAAKGREARGAEARPVVVASMFGNTTGCVNEARRWVEAAGFEVLVFHSTGQGGRAMESLIASGLVAGVLDVTTTEWADEWVGGILGAGPERLDAAAKAGVPAVVAPGCLDMVNFGEPQTVPARFAGREFYQHNPQVTLMRTNAEECAELGRILAEKVNASRGPVRVMWPKGGISALSAPGQPFYDPEADAALLAGLKAHLREGIAVEEMDCAINDPAFARACAEALLTSLKR